MKLAKNARCLTCTALKRFKRWVSVVPEQKYKRCNLEQLASWFWDLYNHFTCMIPHVIKHLHFRPRSQTKLKVLNYIPTVLATRSSTFQLQLLAGDKRKTLLPESFLHSDTLRRSKTGKITWNRYTWMRDIAAYCWWKKPSSFGDLAWLNYSNGVPDFFPSTVPPEQPLFNRIAEMSRRSKT